MTRRTKRFGLVIALVAAMMVMSTSVVLGAGVQISSFTPASGFVGSSVVISGSGFSGATSVRFASAEAAFTVDSDSQITATVPAGVPAKGKISVSTLSGKAKSDSAFIRVVAVKPAITSFSPAGGEVGASVVIIGSHFTDANAVTFGGVAAEFTVDSDVQITATVPAGVPVKGKIKVSTAAGSATSATGFPRSVVAKPTITSFTPATSGIGSAVVITGTHFTGATGVVFGSVAATFHVDSDTRITTTVPSAAPAKTVIQVTTPGGSVKSPAAWVKTAVTSAVITVSPSNSQMNSLVLVQGPGVGSATTVEFGGVPVNRFRDRTSDTVEVVIPDGARTGPVTASAPGHSWRTASDYTVIPFQITSLSTDHGVVGSQVVIIGSGLTAVTNVSIGLEDATFTINSDTRITATVPAGVDSGPHVVGVWSPTAVAQAPQTFWVTP